MTVATLTKENIQLGLAYSCRVVHCHHGETWWHADMVLEKELGVLHLDPQAAGVGVPLARIELIRPQSILPQWHVSSNKATPIPQGLLPMGKAFKHTNSWELYLFKTPRPEKPCFNQGFVLGQ